MRYELDAFECPHCRRNEINPLFVRWFNREIVDLIQPLTDVILISGYRCPEHDHNVGGKGIHAKGIAADFALGTWANDREAARIVLASSADGVGMRLHGPLRKRMFHVDLRGGPELLWTYNEPKE